MAFPTGWGQSHKLTIQNGQVSGSSNLTNFPVLVMEDNVPSDMLDADGSNPCRTDGGDIRFSSDASGTTQLAAEVVEITTDNDPANATLEVWVLVPTVSYNTDTDIYIWWDAAAETEPAAGDTYGRNAVWAGYEAVYHGAEGGSASATNATGNTGTDALKNSPTTQAGPWGDALSLNGTNQGIDAGGLTDPGGTASIEVTAWVNPDTGSLTADMQVFQMWTASDGRFQLWMDAGGSGDGWAVATDVSTTQTVGTDDNNATVATWQYIRGYYDGTDLSVQKNTATATTTSLSGNIDTGGTENSGIGYSDQFSSAYFDGGLKEVRYSATVHSNDWFLTEYAMMNSPSTFLIAESASSGNPHYYYAQQ